MPDGVWNPPRWANYPKHHPIGGNTTWEEVVSRTNSGRRKISRYLSGMRREEIESLEMSVGQVFTEDNERRENIDAQLDVHFICTQGVVRFYYRVVDRVIGASLGEETSIIKIHWHQNGDVHGYPITEEELIGYLRKVGNREELNRYREENQNG